MIVDYPDIYYLPEWAELNQTLDHGIADSFLFRNENGCILYPFIKRRIDIAIDNNVYYDLVTPYGFNGPCVIESLNENRAQLIKDFDLSFKSYCVKNNIISEYVRFSPWLKNRADFETYYSIKENNITIYVDLSCPDFFMDEFSKDCRNHIRKSMKNDLRIEFDFDGHSLPEFEKLYDMMADKNDISSYYRLKIDFFRNTFERMNGNVLLISIICDGIYISSSIFLHYKNHMHYHLSANDPNYFRLNGNSIILYEACKWGKENGITKLHLGGGPQNDPKNSLLLFKKHFTRNGILPYPVGYRVLDSKIYNQLVLKSGSSNEDYFPKYRG